METPECDTVETSGADSRSIRDYGGMLYHML